MTLKSLNFSLLVVAVETEDLSQLADELNKRRIMAPDFFQYAPVVVHVENDTANLDFLRIREIVTENGFILAGVSGELSDSQKEALHADKIAILRRSKRQASKEVVVEDKPAEVVPEEVAETATFIANEVKTKIVTGRVRSGQQIYAKECDLVINGDVSAGAEIIADGNIHIYGTLRGRAIAGAMGDQTASVFCRVLAPELVSIAGVFKLSEGLPHEHLGKSCIVSLRNGQPVIETLN
ncbi:putative septum site-determining protein MinC [Psychromonas marina]|uniref:Probable septum site-determining protein MinC n=1 Tax=Psychromonas marina TaxID=88364 RepID=A0ABQ6DYL1_9GAMM|nr:septum site-determining protein MinC [Psychromonas marina]GLS90080.1 putative septum site-determining protein MinC [Psychromonas marina]